MPKPKTLAQLVEGLEAHRPEPQAPRSTFLGRALPGEPADGAVQLRPER
jgi:hypothetical protein